MRTLFSTSICAITACVLAASSAPIDAQPTTPPTAAARDAFERGKALAGAGKFADAYVAFAAAYQAQPLPAFLFNMGEVARQSDQPDKARSAYQRYLDLEPSGKMAATARERLAALGPAPTPREAAPPAPAAPATDPTLTPRRPPPLPRPSVRPPPAPEGEKLTVMTLPPPRQRSRWPVWAAVGGGVVLAGVATGLYFALRDEGCDSCIDIRP